MSEIMPQIISVNIHTSSRVEYRAKTLVNYLEHSAILSWAVTHHAVRISGVLVQQLAPDSRLFDPNV